MTFDELWITHLMLVVILYIQHRRINILYDRTETLNGKSDFLYNTTLKVMKEIQTQLAGLYSRRKYKGEST